VSQWKNILWKVIRRFGPIARNVADGVSVEPLNRDEFRCTIGSRSFVVYAELQTRTPYRIIYAECIRPEQGQEVITEAERAEVIKYMSLYFNRLDETFIVV
jgi:hypothetical protein